MEDLTTQLTSLRRELHRQPELAGHEQQTARRISGYLSEYDPDEVITGLGGHGVAAVFDSGNDGPTVLIRAELDGLPIPDEIDSEYVSRTDGVGHKCGHDGHMVMVAGLAPLMQKERPTKGRVVLLFQPAEETGQGAREVIEDPQFQNIRPDYVFCLHNLPGFDKGKIIVRDNVFASASKGLIIRLEGATSHAAEPESGKTPALAVANLINGLTAVPQLFTRLARAAKVTIIHARVGEVAFGTSPGFGVVMATLRSHREEVMEKLTRGCLHLANSMAVTWDLKCSTEWVEEFPSTVNTPECVNHLREAAKALNYELHEAEAAFPWSEDFGNFTAIAPGAIFGLGSGADAPALHNPDYDFPDELIPKGLSMFASIIHRYNGALSGETINAVAPNG